MEFYEIEAYTTNLQYRTKEAWEQTRFLSYVIANSNPYRKKEIKPRDILKFQWDDEGEEAKNTQISTEDIERLKAQAEEIKKYLD